MDYLPQRLRRRLSFCYYPIGFNKIWLRKSFYQANKLILGGTASGKSFMVKCYLKHRMKDTSIVVICISDEYKELCEKCGGYYLKITKKNYYQIESKARGILKSKWLVLHIADSFDGLDYIDSILTGLIEKKCNTFKRKRRPPIVVFDSTGELCGSPELGDLAENLSHSMTLNSEVILISQHQKEFQNTPFEKAALNCDVMILTDPNIVLREPFQVDQREELVRLANLSRISIGPPSFNSFLFSKDNNGFLLNGPGRLLILLLSICFYCLKNNCKH